MPRKRRTRRPLGWNNRRRGESARVLHVRRKFWLASFNGGLIVNLKFFRLSRAQLARTYSAMGKLSQREVRVVT